MVDIEIPVESIVPLVIKQYKNRYKGGVNGNTVLMNIPVSKIISYLGNVRAILEDIGIPITVKLSLIKEQGGYFSEAIIVAMDALLTTKGNVVDLSSEDLDLCKEVAVIPISVYSTSMRVIPNLHFDRVEDIPLDRWSFILEDIVQNIDLVLEHIILKKISVSTIDTIIMLYITLVGDENLDGLSEYLQERAVILASC